MVSKTYEPQFQVSDWNGADSRSVAYLIGKSHDVLVSQVKRLNIEFEESLHLCIRTSGKSFQSKCIIMRKSEWMLYLITVPNIFRQKIINQVLFGKPIGEVEL